MHLRPINVDEPERTLRMAMGWTTGFIGLVLVGAQGSAVSVTVGAILAVVGWTFFVTGFLGRCPVYRRLGRTSRTLRRADVKPTPIRVTARPSDPVSSTRSRRRHSRRGPAGPGRDASVARRAAAARRRPRASEAAQAAAARHAGRRRRTERRARRR